MTSAQLINQTSGKTEYYTLSHITEAARETMGGIDTDPASSVEANRHVRAGVFYDREHDGLARDWYGRVWLNHPFHNGWKACDDKCKRTTCLKRGFHVFEDIPGNADWINKLENEFMDGRTTQACCITFACTSEKWFQPLLRRPQCFLHPRTNYLLPDGSVLKGVTKGSVVSYFGTRVTEFTKAFAGLGVVKVAI